ncbi:MAG TPA: hypothetical protein VKT80_05075, partial [Chloroflexota bacterium]|nr:hypothetical protein [Chloroflexota bacterium]
AGGASAGTGANSNGGNLVVSLGAAGTGGSGAAGSAGQSQVKSGSTVEWEADSAGNTVQLGSGSFGSSPPACTAGTSGALCLKEGTAATGLASTDIVDANSTQHAASVNNNNTGDSPISRVQCVNVTPVTVSANVTTDQNLMSCTLNANLLNVAGRTLLVRATGTYSTAAASTASITMKVKLCTVSGCGSGTVITPLSASTGATAALTASNLMAQLQGNIITQTAGASSAYEAQGSMLIDLSATATVASSVYPAINTATVGTIDSTGQIFLQVTGAFSAASTSNVMTERQLIVEVVN